MEAAVKVDKTRWNVGRPTCVPRHPRKPRLINTEIIEAQIRDPSLALNKRPRNHATLPSPTPLRLLCTFLIISRSWSPTERAFTSRLRSIVRLLRILRFAIFRNMLFPQAITTLNETS